MIYAKNGKIFASDNLELYIPISYFDNKMAFNKGSYIESFGVVYIKSSIEDKMKLINIPTLIKFLVYSTKEDVIKVHDKQINVLTLQYLKDSYVFHQSFPNGREIANMFLDKILAGKLPNTLSYEQILDIWWTNLEMSGVSFNVPSKIYEMIIANIYRNPNNIKQRFGQVYGKQENPNPYKYKSASVRNVVKNLSTFSGIIFEDMNAMITNGLNNSKNNEEEPESPLEKIIHY